MTIRTSEEGRRLRHARCLPSRPVRPEIIIADLAKDICHTNLSAPLYYDPVKAALIQRLPLFRLACGENVEALTLELRA